MFPTIKDGEEITVEPVEPSSVRRGDILVFANDRGVTAHRLVGMRKTDQSRLCFVLRGDACDGNEKIEACAIMGRVISVDRPAGTTRLAGARARFRYRGGRVISGLGRWLRWVFGSSGSKGHRGCKIAGILRSLAARFSLLSILAVFGVLPLPRGLAAQLDSVQTGTVTISDTNTFVTDTITSVDTSKSLLLFSNRLGSDVPLEPNHGMVSGELTSGTTVRFERKGSTGTITVNYYVAEFSSGVTVERGDVDISAATTNVTITSVDTAKSFPIISMRTTGSLYSRDDFFRADITTSTNLQLSANTFGGTPTVEWQVVEYTDCTIQTGDVSFATGDSSKTATLTSVDTAKTWLLYTYETDINSAQADAFLVRGQLTDATTLTFDRDGTGTTVDVTYYAVEFTDGTSVQRGSESFTTSETQNDVTITSVDTTWAVASAGDYGSGGKSAYSADDDPATGWFTLDLSSATNLKITRGVTGTATADVGWFVVQFVANATAVELRELQAWETAAGVELLWRTGYEVDNLGFHLYREQEAGLQRVTSSLVAGSALLAGKGIPLAAGRSYRWSDSKGVAGAHYWLQDVDLDGTRTWHGPVVAEPSNEKAREVRAGTLLNALGQGAEVQTTGPIRAASNQTEAWEAAEAESELQDEAQSPIELHRSLVAQPGVVKLQVNQAGWYRVSQPTLVRAGLEVEVDPTRLQLYLQGRQISIIVNGERDGLLDPRDTIEFFGQGQDTESTAEQTYWLVEGEEQGRRIRKEPGPWPGARQQSFGSMVVSIERTIYFAALRNGEATNFFGPVVGAQPVERTLRLRDLDPYWDGNRVLEVALQGATAGLHRVSVQLNGVEIDQLQFEGQQLGEARVLLPAGLLLQGENTLQLVSEEETDVSLLDRVRIEYGRRYQADEGLLHFTLPAAMQTRIEGFWSSQVRVMDVTDPSSVVELSGLRQRLAAGSYAVTVTAPGEAGEGERELLAFTDPRVLRPVATKENHPSRWHAQQQGADLVMISHADFLPALAPLVRLRKQEGYRVAVVDVEDIYDEFSFGAKTPWAIRDFLLHATNHWQLPPRFLLLVGDASFDPRNYLGLGDFDFLPTKLVGTALLETASDDWFADFSNQGLPEIAIGRLPARTAAEAETMVAKIADYAHHDDTGPWTNQVLLVADTNDDFDFEAATAEISDSIPSFMSVQQVLRGRTTDAAARRTILQSLNQGKLLVN